MEQGERGDLSKKEELDSLKGERVCFFKGFNGVLMECLYLMVSGGIKRELDSV